MGVCTREIKHLRGPFPLLEYISSLKSMCVGEQAMGLLHAFIVVGKGGEL